MRTLMTSLACCSLLLFGACGDDDDDTVPTIDGGGIDAPGAELTCAAYCTTIAANCTGDNRQYGAADDAQEASCLTTCATWEEGTIADMTGATLGCHLYHAGAAAGTGAATHCIHAGPTGGTGAQCGSPCANFCTLALSACTGDNEQFGGDMATCMTECEAFATDPPYTANQTTMNTFACRVYHATVASTSAANATTHCAHISTESTPETCGTAP